ncbi:MAG TPA: hypothetical protein VL986_05270 [Terracidiphilus sp.]|nr:hypothetical protein [Terracidiphilus sp.]
MAEFYEFHDSYLEAIDHIEGRLVLRMKAYRHTWPGEAGVGEGTGWFQEIVITVENPTIISNLKAFPLQVLDGSLKGENIECEEADRVGDQIPSSLRGSGEIEIRIEGIVEQTEEFGSATVRGTAAAITSRGPAQFVETLNWQI